MALGQDLRFSKEAPCDDGGWRVRSACCSGSRARTRSLRETAFAPTVAWTIRSNSSAALGSWIRSSRAGRRASATAWGPVGALYRVDASVYSGATHLVTLFRGQRRGSATPFVQRWNGRDGAGEYADPGEYTVRIVARSVQGQWSVEVPVSVVRLGITELEAVAADEPDEWQMVYFRKDKDFEFFATPATHEYLNIADEGETSDLDENNGEPRSSVPIHEATDEPVLEFEWWSKEWHYDDDRYNYPLCYARAAQPSFELRLGDNATSWLGGRIDCGYPVAGYQIRMRVRDAEGEWFSLNDDLSPGGTALFVGPPLPDRVTRTDRLG